MKENVSNFNIYHFNYIILQTYTQMLEYYRPGGPIFIYINDLGQFTTEFLEIGLMHDIAIDAGAALITADQRFFRSNLPTELVYREGGIVAECSKIG